MNILLANAAADGREPAGRLAELLRPLGVMALDAGSAAPQGTGVIALLTPAALADPGVLFALQRASAEGRPLLPLSAPNPAGFPAPGDLARILEWRGASPAAAAPDQGAKYYIANATHTAIGDNSVTVNLFGPAAGGSAAETAQLVAALRALQPAAPMSAQELRGLFAGLQAQIQGVDLALREGLTLILARFDANEQRFLAPLLARLDGQEAALVAAVLDALDGRAFPADELGQHLAMIQMALSQLLIRAEQTGDRQLAAGVQHAAAVAGAPNLDVKHKLKVTLPILPAFISYEGEIELSDGMTLRQVWEGLQTWATRRGPAAAGR